jgi:hypothetical protein
MTCRRRMPADGSRKKDYRAGPCKCPGSRFLWRAQAQRRRPLRVKAAPSATICTAYTACTCQTRPPPPASLPLRPINTVLVLEDLASRLPVRKLRSNGYSMLLPARLMFGPDGSSRTPALKAESSRELHGMLPRSTRDKAGGRRTRHGLGWRGERRGWRGRRGRRGRSVIQGGAGTKGNNETRPQSPGAAALQQTQSAHSAPTLISDQDPIIVLVLCESTGQCLRDFANLAGGTQYAAECCVGSRSLSTIKVAGWLAGWGLVRCRFASTSGIPSPSFTNRRLHTYWELHMDSFVEQQCTDSHVANASRRLHPAFRASSTSSGLP